MLKGLSVETSRARRIALGSTPHDAKRAGMGLLISLGERDAIAELLQYSTNSSTNAQISRNTSVEDWDATDVR
jgi:hypothetical protein